MPGVSVDDPLAIAQRRGHRPVFERSMRSAKIFQAKRPGFLVFVAMRGEAARDETAGWSGCDLRIEGDLVPTRRPPCGDAIGVAGLEDDRRRRFRRGAIIADGQSDNAREHRQARAVRLHRLDATRLQHTALAKRLCQLIGGKIGEKFHRNSSLQRLSEANTWTDELTRPSRLTSRVASPAWSGLRPRGRPARDGADSGPAFRRGRLTRSRARSPVDRG